MPPPWLTKGRHLPDGGLERVGLLLHLGARARRADLIDQPLQIVEEGAPCAGRTGVALRRGVALVHLEPIGRRRRLSEERRVRRRLGRGAGCRGAGGAAAAGGASSATCSSGVQLARETPHTCVLPLSVPSATIRRKLAPSTGPSCVPLLAST